MSLRSTQLPSLRRIARAAAFASAFVGIAANAATLQIQLTDSHDRNAAGLAVVVETSTVEPAPAKPPTAVIDQSHEQFVPRVSIVRRGTEVSFPNTDRVQHHVYSFSPAKQFELSLYRGNEHPPVTFDQDGTVVLGCNIHDHMVGYVLVVDGSHFGFTDENGRLSLDGLPDESVKVTVWHPDLGVDYGAFSRSIALAPGDNPMQLHLDRTWPAKQEASLSWNGY
jgi:plastocyanin